jgi:beta-1,4-N-acetylglucosaminyltransferase
VILVTVGMHTDGFPRLVQEMERIATQVDEDVVMQIGATRHEPRAARWFTFPTQEQMDALCEQARVIVSHAGAGSILAALRYRKPLIVVPRRREHGEVIDDHQLELADALSRAGALLVANEVCELGAKLEEAAHFSPRLPQSHGLINAARRAVTADAHEEG